MKSKPILALDFDGVMHSYPQAGGWKGSGMIPNPAVPGLVEFLHEAVKEFQVCVFSSRSENIAGRAGMKSWLQRQVLSYYETGKAGPWTMVTVYDLVNQIGFPMTKPAAFVSLDDRALTFTGQWPSVNELRSFTPWWKEVTK
jgi:hypothetical protein